MVTLRKNPLVTGETYHIFNKSIAEYKIFNTEEDFKRMEELFVYYQVKNINQLRFSVWKKCKGEFRETIFRDKFVEIIAYCIMPTHIHLILKQLLDKGITIFMSQISNSYARYFNIKHKRKGPLWEGEFKNKIINNEEQLLHLTRYIHLNPVSARLVENPEEWRFSSYKEFLRKINKEDKICNFDNLINIDPLNYKKFVEDRISYQRELEKIKNLTFE